MKAKAPYRLLYNNDNTNTVGCVSPWHEKGEPFREEMLVASIEEVADKGVDCYLLSPGMGWVPWWQSDVEPDFYDWWQERTGLPVTGYDRYIYQGGDMVQVLVDTCRRYGMAPFVSLRMNDVHHQDNYVQKNKRSLVSCRFYVEHPEWHIDRNHPEKSGYYKQRGMDWAVPEVRQYKLNLLQELAENYDLAGIELDFLRDDVLFHPDGPDETERIEIISCFAQNVRQILDQNTVGRKQRYLGVRIPCRIDHHAQSGLDVQRLHEAGVDMFNLSGWYHTTQRTDVGRVRELVPDAALYVEMTHSTSRYPHFIQNPNYGCDGDPRTSPEQFYTTARLAYERGADGVSLFNFAYYRSGHHPDVPVMEPPFHVLPQLRDPAFLARQPQYYMAGTCSYDRQLPHDLTETDPVTVTLDMLEQDSVTSDGRLRVHTREPLSPDSKLTVLINGETLERSDNISRLFGNPFDGMISPKSNRRAWILPAPLVRDGENTVEICLDQGPPLTVIYVDAGIEPPEPLAG
ncbi:MAG: hypothetical protein ACLFWL_05480 [Candidatus Brocadiia bacterium]